MLQILYKTGVFIPDVEEAVHSEHFWLYRSVFSLAFIIVGKPISSTALFNSTSERLAVCQHHLMFIRIYPVLSFEA